MRTNTQATVVGVFRDYPAAEEAVAELHREGFRYDQIDIFVRYKKDIKHRTRKRKVEEVALANSLVGPVALVAESEVDEEVLEPKAPHVHSRKGEAVAALVAMGVPELEARVYEEELHAGRPLVIVRADNRADEARAVWQKVKAVDVTRKIENEHQRVEKERARTEEKARRERELAEEKARKERERAEEKARKERERAEEKARKEREKVLAEKDRAGTTALAREAAERPARSQTATAGGQTVEVREEELHATKRPVEKGEVKVRKEVTTEHRTLEVPVTREEVVIERKAPRDRHAAGEEIQGQEIRIPVKEEEVVVEKRPVVK